MDSHTNHVIFRDGRFSQWGKHRCGDSSCREISACAAFLKEIHLSSALSKRNSKHPTHQTGAYYCIFAISELTHRYCLLIDLATAFTELC